MSLSEAMSEKLERWGRRVDAFRERAENAPPEEKSNLYGVFDELFSRHETVRACLERYRRAADSAEEERARIELEKAARELQASLERFPPESPSNFPTEH
jgi:CRP-like cAMP-binding protein